MVSTSIERSSPRRMIEPLPNCFSIWPSAAANAFCLFSSIAIFTPSLGCQVAPVITTECCFVQEITANYTVQSYSIKPIFTENHRIVFVVRKQRLQPDFVTITGEYLFFCTNLTVTRRKSEPHSAYRFLRSATIRPGNSAYRYAKSALAARNAPHAISRTTVSLTAPYSAKVLSFTPSKSCFAALL